jgi:diguanylate cyclase (GGDEF)-like protein
VNALLEDRHGDLWIGSSGGLVRRDASGALTAYRNRPQDGHSLPGDRVQAIIEDDAGRIWVGTSGGLALHEEGDSFAVYRHNPVDTASLPDDNVISLFEDRGGLLWVGTKTGGVAKWNSRSWSFGHQGAGEVGGSEESNVAAFAEDASGTMWVANLGTGIDAVDRVHGTTQHYRHLATDASSLPDDRVTALLYSRKGTLWVGTMTAGLCSFDPQTHRFSSVRHDANDPNGLGAQGVMSLLEDSSGRIWVGTYGGGLALLDPATGRFTRFMTDPDNPASLSSDRATALAEDQSGLIWVGTDGGGLSLLDPDHATFTRFAHDPQNAHSLSANTVYAIRVDQQGRVWVGTRGGGLDEVVGSALAPGAIRFRNFSEAEGLPNTTIYGIETSADGHLWLSTNNGLSRFDAATHDVRNFRAAHGLQGDEFNFGAHFRASDGELFFGGPHGYNAYYPQRLQFDDKAPPVVLTAFLKFNEPAVTGVPHERLRNIELGYRDDIVTFEFAALDFASPQDNRYRYMLEGFDKGWVDAGSKHRVTYTNLAGGHYTFRVRAANSDGKWNEAGLAIPISVQPPPWASPPAYALYALALGLLMFAVWNQQHKKLRREARYAQRLERDVRDRTVQLAERNEELERVNRQLKEASVTDPLTGLGNRRYLRDAVATLTKSPEESPTLALLIVDLDHLKPVNDIHGHEAGDQILIQVAEILRRNCRTSDFIARWGGDEFVIVYRDEDLSGAEILAERIRSRVAKQIFRLADGKAARTSCSIGFSRYPFVHEAPHLLPWEQCLAVADAALYHAKKQRNGWFGWAGTAAAIDVPSIVKLLERDPDTLERDGRLDVRRPGFRPQDTVDDIQARNQRRNDQ